MSSKKEHEYECHKKRTYLMSGKQKNMTISIIKKRKSHDL